MLKKYYIGLFFLVSTAVGTVSHEAGHYLTAKALGYDAYITYRNTSTGYEYANKYLVPYYKKLRSGEDFPEKEEVQQRIKKFQEDELLISIGGPLCTLIIGLSGLFILFFFYSNRLIITHWQWVWIFVALFMLRFPFVFGMTVVKYWLAIAPILSDEIVIAYLLKINGWTINTTLAIIGAAIAAIVFFKFIPVQERRYFILWALISIPISYAAWFMLLGPLLLPPPSF